MKIVLILKNVKFEIVNGTFLQFSNIAINVWTKKKEVPFFPCLLAEQMAQMTHG